MRGGNMLNAVLDVKEVPGLLVSRFHSNTISWREENGALIFQPTNDLLNRGRKRAAFERLKGYRRVLPKDFDYKKELLDGIDEKYGNINRHKCGH
jgi:hypothetical protein